MHLLKPLLINLLAFFGAILIIAIGLSFTCLPFKAYHYLSAPHYPIKSNPECILILGGAGMPSADGLRRTHFGSEVAGIFLSAKVIIAHTANHYKKDSLKKSKLMARELVLRGVDTNRIYFEFDGTYTFTQANNVFNQIWDKSVLVVTSPQHMLRAILTLKRSDFTDVGGLPKFESPIDPKSLVRKNINNIDVPEDLALRINMWSYLIYEIKVAREFTALLN